MGYTIAQKIISEHLLSGDITKVGSEIGLRIDQTLTQDATGTLAYLEFEAMGIPRVKTELSVAYIDHNTLQSGFENADDHRFIQSAAKKYGLYYSRPGNGICHQVHLERFGAPGKTLIGSDSHTPTGGGLGMLAFGAGGLDVAVAMGGGAYYIVMPKMTRINLHGRLAPWVSAKDVILDFWGIPQDAIGEGKYFADKDSAIESITGYDLEGAKNLFNQAYDKAVELGIYDGKETIQINIGTPNNTSKFYTRGYTFLVNCWTEAVKGTKLEGKLEFVNDSTLGDAFGDALRANTVDMLFGVGWSGSSLNPYGLIGAYTEDDYRYDKSWNTSAVMMDFTIADGTTLRASVLDWTYAISGDTIEARVVVNGEETDEVVEYSCGNADNKPEERILLLAAIEGIVLANYDMIPTHNQASASLLGYQVEYGNQEYVYGVGRGGLQYMTYNYTDAEWVDYVASQGGILVYN